MRSARHNADRQKDASSKHEVHDDHEESYSQGKTLDESGNVKRTVDSEQTTSVVAPVTHETVNPHVHEIKEERITREIHTHDVYHRVQPVIEVEIKPTRHLVPDGKGRLMEVAEKDLPDCTGKNQEWYIAKRIAHGDQSASRDPPELARAKNEGEKTFTTAEGIERTETTVVHPPTLEAQA
ncbi:hypothetical protein B0T22DRAFT_463592 [Podospora appendiculata]|uniref:Uncharacterized protein n=1 Tax=Podospora appendiculata TaxID=314037 RepID=A0AAE0XD90_9PEZI|nr:hypothetical protein B0T22DRAFT_463592 [Podospora appendiculata]